MKIKLFNIVSVKKVFDKLLTTNFQEGETASKLAYNIKNINIELSKFEESRRNLIIKYGEKEGEDIIKVLDLKKDEYMKELNDLLQQEVEINITPIKVEKLCNVSPLDITLIDWMLDVSYFDSKEIKQGE